MENQLYQPRQEKSDEDWDKLYNEERLKSSLKKAEEKRHSLSSDQVKKLRYLCKHNTYFLAKTVLGYDRLSKVLHADLCNWIDETDGERFRLVLMPRGHFKSTVDTITKSIQVALPLDEDFDLGRLDLSEEERLKLESHLNKIYPANLGPDVRILIGHETAGMAETFLFEIANHFTGNELLMALYPEIVPSPKLQRMNKQLLDLPRSKIWKEATFSTMGVGGKSQGYHFNYLFLDDLIGEKARDSEAEMQTAKNWVDNIQAFFSVFAKDKIFFSGTRYANDDLYSHLMDRYGDKLKVYHRAVEEKNEKGVKEPIFPEEFDAESLATIKKNKKVFNAQYMNDPDAGATAFDESWIQWFEWQSPYVLTTFRQDLLSGNKVKQIVKLRDCFISLLWDPALTGDSGWCITATDALRRTFVLEAFEGEIGAPETVDKMFSLYSKYQFNILAIEEVLFSELYRHWLNREFLIRGVAFNIKGIDIKQSEKTARVAALSNNLSARELYFNETYYSRGTRDKTGKDSDLIWEIKKFGSIKQYHTLDALANGPQVWQPGFDRAALEKAKQREKDRLATDRNIQTGYSSIKYRSR